MSLKDFDNLDLLASGKDGLARYKAALYNAGHILEKHSSSSEALELRACIDELKAATAHYKGEALRFKIMNDKDPDDVVMKLRDIAREVCDKHGCTMNDLKSERRFKALVLARHEAFYKARLHTRQSYPQIGRFFGGRDHTTIIHGVRKHAKQNNLPVPGEPT